MTDKTVGGVRRGAGRPRSLTPPLRKTAVTLEEIQVEWLRELGAGSVSEGVRHLIESHPSFRSFKQATNLHHVPSADGETLQVMSREEHEGL